LFGPLGYSLLVLAIGGGLANSVPIFVTSVAVVIPLVAGAWISKRRSKANLKGAIILLATAAGMVTVLCLARLLPASVFWVVSAAVPAWQAWRLMEREDLRQASDALHYAMQLFLGVMSVALWLPVVLSFR
jgi:flagellar biosynthesis component FlhA